ncbi:MAG TPA: hypothetical protein PKK78_19305 [Kouleothrix sp.]|jgi:D-alanine-D-alanine ligase|nr:hypothetical protein [Kouleothrix sp.]
MNVGLLFERKADYPFTADDPADSDSELLSAAEERELIEGVAAAGHHVVVIGDTNALLEGIDTWRAQCDIVLNRSVGYRGPERKSIAPAILEAAGIPYVGSGPYALSLTRNKYHAKLVASAAGLPTPPAALLPGGIDNQIENLLYPAIVKPVAESSSIGIEAGQSIVTTPEQARERAHIIAMRYQQPALIETFIEGVEVEVPLLMGHEPRVLGVFAITINGQLPPAAHYLASEQVYIDGYGYTDPPAYIDTNRLADIAIQGALALGIRDYGRLDFRVSADGTPWFIEASTHPHIQRHSSFYVVARRAGMSYAQMLDMLIQAAAQRYGLDAYKCNEAGI